VINMFDFPELNQMMIEYGSVTCYNFFVYGNMTEEEIKLLVDGVRIKTLMRGFTNHLVIFSSYVDEDLATMLKHYQGTTITIAFGGTVSMKELVEGTIMDGLKFLHYKGDFYGETISESHV
tara:strand:+ start:450 stop:812 length:363 start_codon:yes stop_codon:yes gene_type:complete